jgi:hypothetical protein
MENHKAIATILMIAIWSGWVESAHSLSFINYDAARPTIASSPALNGVGYVFSIAPGASTGSACTGSAISSTVVVTAGHCLMPQHHFVFATKMETLYHLLVHPRIIQRTWAGRLDIIMT